MVAAIGALTLVVITASVATTAAGGVRSMASTSTRPALASDPSAAPAPAAAPMAAGSPAPTFAQFSNGIFEIGADIRPGTYRMRTAADGCYFARLKGFGGGLEDILANGNPDGPAVVTILPSDKGFQSDNCATWTADLSPVARDSSFGAGDYVVGTDLKPGTYRNSGGGQGCYYARLRGFTHAVSEVIANNNTSGPAIVTVAASDKGFTSTGCGTWTRA